jgi:hypothetical protein
MSQSMIGNTKHVRIDHGVYKRLLSLSQKMGMSAAEIATFCIEDCLRAYESNKAVVPRISLITQIIESGPRLENRES